MAQPDRPIRAPAERWRHGSDFEGLAYQQRIADGGAALFRNGKIGGAEVAAADRWYQDYALGVEGVFDAPGRGAGGGDAHTAMFARAAAKLAWRGACEAVGAYGSTMLRLLIVEGKTLAAVGREAGIHNSEATGAVVAAIRRLTEHYAAVDQGRPEKKARGAELSACNATKEHVL